MSHALRVPSMASYRHSRGDIDSCSDNDFSRHCAQRNGATNPDLNTGTYPLMCLGAGKYRSDDRPTWIVRWIAYFLIWTFKRTGCADKQVRWVCTKSCMTTTRTTRHHAPSRKPIGCVQLHMIDTHQSQCLHAVELESVLGNAALLRMFDFTTTNCMW
jgi:hypothetical protein